MGLVILKLLYYYAIAQVPAGMLSDNFGGKKVSSVGLSVMAIAALLFSFPHNFGAALVLRCLGVSLEASFYPLP